MIKILTLAELDSDLQIAILSTSILVKKPTEEELLSILASIPVDKIKRDTLEKIKDITIEYELYELSNILKNHIDYNYINPYKVVK